MIFTDLRTAAATVGVAVPLAFAGVAIANDHRGNPNETPPGQANKQEQTAPPSHASNERSSGQGKSESAGENGKAKSPSKSKAKSPTKSKAKSKPTGKAKSQSKAQSKAPKTNSHAKAGKTTICHATGSATNPYVTITISDNALPAHRRHQDGRDLIPAPAGGCPKGDSAPAQSQGSTKAKSKADAKANGKTTICHATGSATNPFVTITISNNALAAHRAHQHGEDIIPAPAAGCPGAGPGKTVAGPPTPGQGLAPLTTAQTPPPAGVPAGAPAATVPATQEVLGVSVRSTPRAAVQGADDDGDAPAGAPAAEVLNETAAGTDTRPVNTGSLPFTGLDLGLVALLGLAALLGGVALRRSLQSHRGVS